MILVLDIKYIALRLVNRIMYTKILKGFIILCQRFSETFRFPLYIFDNDSSY